MAGAEHARDSRYVYVVVAMVFPALALAADAIIRRWRQAAVGVVALWLVALPGNIDQLANYTGRGAGTRASRSFILTAPRLAHRPQVARLQAPIDPGDLTTTELTIGWLIDSVPSGRVPDPGRRSPTDDADATLRLAAGGLLFSADDSDVARFSVDPAVGHPGAGPKWSPCTATQRSLTFRFRSTRIATNSAFNSGSLVARAGPLRIRVAPTHGPVTLVRVSDLTSQPELPPTGPIGVPAAARNPAKRGRPDRLR